MADGDAPDFDVALSFAGEDRLFVGAVADALRQKGVRVFYDEYFATDLWGEDLYEYLDDVYQRRARFAALFVSRHYLAKAWTNHERRSAQARALQSETPYLLPIRLDATELPGLRPTVGYLDASRLSPSDVAARMLQKVGTPRMPSPDPPLCVPRSATQVREMFERRPRRLGVPDVPRPPLRRAVEHRRQVPRLRTRLYQAGGSSGPWYRRPRVRF